MIFLAPLLASMAALALIPAIIYFLLKRKPRLVRFAAIEFILRSLKKTKRKTQIRELILLALRTLAILLAALAMARPTFRKDKPGAEEGGEVLVALVIDASLSMQTRQGAGTRFDEARARAGRALESLPRNSRALLVTVNDRAVAEVPEPTRDLALVGARLTELTPADSGSDLMAGLEAALALLEKHPAADRELMLFSDFQANGVPGPDDPRMAAFIARLNALSPPARLILLPVADDPVPENTQVLQLRLDDDMPMAGVPLQVEALLRHHGAASRDGFSAECWIAGPSDEKPAKRAEIFLDRVEGERIVRFPVRFTETGPHRIQVRVTADRLPADDSAQLMALVAEPMRVLVVDADPRSESLSFLRAALSPRDPEGEIPPPALLRRIGPEDLALHRLADYRTVILQNPPVLSAAAAAVLNTYLNAGGGVLVFPGPRSGEGALEALLAPEGSIPLRLGERLAFGEEGTTLSTSRLHHPVVAVFNTPEERPFLEEARFYQAYALPAAAGPETPDTPRLALAFASGEAAAWEQDRGAGRLLLFAFPLDRAWTDLPLRPVFPPLVSRATRLIGQMYLPGETVRVHEPLVTALRGADLLESWSVQAPGGERAPLPAGVETRGGGRLATYTQNSNAGFYRIDAANPGFPTRWFAVNPPAEAGLLASLGDADLRDRFPSLPFAWIAKGEDLLQAIAALRVGKEIWRTLGALALLCLLAEWILCALWAPREGTA